MHDESRPALVLVPFEASKHGEFSEFVVSLASMRLAYEYLYRRMCVGAKGRGWKYLFLELLVDGV